MTIGLNISKHSTGYKKNMGDGSQAEFVVNRKNAVNDLSYL